MHLLCPLLGRAGRQLPELWRKPRTSSGPLGMTAEARVEQRRLAPAGVDLNVALLGPEDGPAVMLLHGWPDSHVLWRHQALALAADGFRVVMPDLRGYGDSEKPDDVAAYGLPTLLADAVGVLDELDIAACDLVGHDWGGVIAWVA